MDRAGDSASFPCFPLQSGCGRVLPHRCASQGAPERSFPDLTFTPNPSKTPVLEAVSPSRGSTEGGTPITLLGTFPMDAGQPTVAIGGVTCGSVVQVRPANTSIHPTPPHPLSSTPPWPPPLPTLKHPPSLRGAHRQRAQVNASVITCITAAPGAPKPLGPRPIIITFPAVGFAALAPAAATPITGGASPAAAGYTYVDLWSRRSTWGGEDPPVEGDSVVVPAGKHRPS